MAGRRIALSCSSCTAMLLARASENGRHWFRRVGWDEIIPASWSVSQNGPGHATSTVHRSSCTYRRSTLDVSYSYRAPHARNCSHGGRYYQVSYCHSRCLSTTSQSGSSSRPKLQLGLPKPEKSTMTKAAAKVAYLLRDEDLENVKAANVGGGIGSPVVYLVVDLERACLRRWGSEKEFRREQLRREIQRRRKELRQRNLQAVIDSGAAAPTLYGFDKLAALLSGHHSRHEPQNRSEAFADLPWDPSLGKMPDFDQRPLGLKAVNTAIVTNAVVAASKLAAFVMTGSASILSEAVHSIADLGNQCLLSVGITQSLKDADATHPYGYTVDRYVWSLISGVGIFFLGCGVSVYHGLLGLLHPHDIEHVAVGMSVLGISFLVEGYSLFIAVQECRHEAKKSGTSFKNYVFHGTDATNVAVLMEDSVAVLGCGIAAGSLLASHVTGNPVWDSLGSITVGSLLGVVATILIQKNRLMLLGSALPEAQVRRVVALLEADPAVSSLHDVKAIRVGADRGRFKAEVKFDAEELARRCIARSLSGGGGAAGAAAAATAAGGVHGAGGGMVSGFGVPSGPAGGSGTDAAGTAAAFMGGSGGAGSMSAAGLVEALRVATGTGEVEALLMRYSMALVATLGDEVDRLEGIIRRELPEIRHVDLEII